MSIKIITFSIFVLNTLALLAIFGLFLLSFFFPDSGPFFIIFAACALLAIGILFACLCFLERKNDQYFVSLAAARRYLSVSLHIILLVQSVIAFFSALVFFLCTMNSYFLVMGGCTIAFIMIIILIELFLRILLPLAGVNQRT